MVLTGSPYFNEAGYDKQIGTSNGQLNSKNYNELVIVRLCDHIVASIRYVPWQLNLKADTPQQDIKLPIGIHQSEPKRYPKTRS